MFLKFWFMLIIKKNALLMFLFMFIIVLSVTIVCYPENVALIF